MTSLGLLVRNSIDMQGTKHNPIHQTSFSNPTKKREVLTRASVNRIRFLARVCIVLQLGLLEGLNGFVFIHPLSSSPTRLATMLRIVSGRSPRIKKKNREKRINDGPLKASKG